MWDSNPKSCGRKGSECSLRNLFKRSKLARLHRDAHRKVAAERAAEAAAVADLRGRRLTRAPLAKTLTQGLVYGVGRSDLAKAFADVINRRVKRG
jgi:hypothetical protein